MNHRNARRPTSDPQGGRSMTVAAILAVFVGGFGIHRVYLGQYWRALLYFVFSWTFIPTFFGIVDAIRYVAMGQEEFDRRFNPDVYHRRLADDAAYAQLMYTASLNEQAPPAPEIRSPRSSWKGGGAGAWRAYQAEAPSTHAPAHAFDPSARAAARPQAPPPPATWETNVSPFASSMEAVRGRLERAFDPHAELLHLHEELLAGRLTEHDYLARRERVMRRT